MIELALLELITLLPTHRIYTDINKSTYRMPLPAVFERASWRGGIGPAMTRLHYYGSNIGLQPSISMPRSLLSNSPTRDPTLPLTRITEKEWYA